MGLVFFFYYLQIHILVSCVVLAGCGEQPAAAGGQRGEGHDERGDISETDTRAHAQVQQIHELTLRYSRYTSSCSGTADNQAHAHCSVGWSVEIFFDRSEQVN